MSLSRKIGNYMVFFLLSRGWRTFTIFRNKTEERQFEVSCILQSSNMIEQEREEFEAFQKICKTR